MPIEAAIIGIQAMIEYRLTRFEGKPMLRFDSNLKGLKNAAFSAQKTSPRAGLRVDHASK
jgi:hypothetical protein